MSRRLAFALPALLLLAAGCHAPTAEPDTEPAMLRATGPANVAVLPPRTDRTALTAPTGALRDAATTELLARGFSTLNRVLVDAQYRANPEALSFPNSGMLDLLVHRWNDSLAETEGILALDVEAKLYAEDGGLVGTARLDRSLRLSTQDLSSLAPAARSAELLRRAAAALLEPFPGPPPL